jgi:hypothetical protein
VHQQLDERLASRDQVELWRPIVEICSDLDLTESVNRARRRPVSNSFTRLQTSTALDGWPEVR